MSQQLSDDQRAELFYGTNQGVFPIAVGTGYPKRKPVEIEFKKLPVIGWRDADANLAYSRALRAWHAAGGREPKPQPEDYV